MKNILISFMLAICALTAGCHSKAAILIPDFETAAEQYMFAKNMRERSFFHAEKKDERRDKAIVMAYDKILERFPDDMKITPLAYVELGDIHYRRKDYKKAIAIYEKSILKYSTQDEIVCKALFGAASAYDHQKDFEKAMNYYKMCYERFESDQRAFLAVIGAQARINYSKIRIR
ncbi:MAG TPA: tetratricopeptide repeat protein [Candidatus Sumerlaeota bacterium]|nr:tetratricopeptide repeat protein [Candidatus Sumerlaeota bacterium]